MTTIHEEKVFECFLPKKIERGRKSIIPLWRVIGGLVTEPETASETESLIGLCCFRTLASDCLASELQRNNSKTFLYVDAKVVGPRRRGCRRRGPATLSTP